MLEVRSTRQDTRGKKQEVRSKKKGQTEIIGLVIVMVLIVMGIMFTMLFVFGKEDKGLSEEFREADLPQSMLDAILKTTSSCTGRTIDQSLSDCRTASRTINCGSTPICKAVEQDAKKILEATLEKWEYPYKLSFDISNTECADSQGCVKDIQSQDFACVEYRTGSQKRNVAGQTFEMVLILCQ